MHEDELHRVELAEVTDDAVVVKVSEKTTGAARTSRFPLDLFLSHGYRSMQATHKRLIEITGEPPFELQHEQDHRDRADVRGLPPERCWRWRRRGSTCSGSRGWVR